MKTLLVDGQWLLKKNFKGQAILKSSNGTLCGGVIGFMFNLKTVMNKLLPDRVVVAWDGFHSGKLRFDIYPQYKISRGHDYASEDRAIMTGGAGSPEDMERFEM